MFCKWCGMESKDNTKCEWCGRAFSASSGPQPTVQMPVGGPLDPRAAGTTPVPTSAAAISRDRLTFKPATVEIPELPPFGLRFERYMAVMSLLFAGGLLAARYHPSLWLVPLLVLSFFSGLFLAVYRVIGYYDDEMLDVTLVLIFSAFVGPVYATGILLILCLIRREANWSMLGLMASFFVIRFSIGAVAHGMDDTLNYLGGFNVYLGMMQWCLQLVPLSALFGGWMMASFSRPLNE